MWRVERLEGVEDLMREFREGLKVLNEIGTPQEGQECQLSKTS